MSYILDALNKSERERTRKRTPGLSSLNNREAPTPGVPGFLVIFFAVAALNAIGVYFFFGDRIQEAESTVAEGTIAELPKVEPPPETAAEEPVQSPTPPELEITAHIYASDSELRMVKIDGVSRREGDEIGDNHQLIEITEIGVILEYSGTRYELDVVEDWQIR